MSFRRRVMAALVSRLNARQGMRGRGRSKSRTFLTSFESQLGICASLVLRYRLCNYAADVLEVRELGLLICDLGRPYRFFLELFVILEGVEVSVKVGCQGRNSKSASDVSRVSGWELKRRARKQRAEAQASRQSGEKRKLLMNLRAAGPWVAPVAAAAGLAFPHPEWSCSWDLGLGSALRAGKTVAGRTSDW